MGAGDKRIKADAYQDNLLLYNKGGQGLLRALKSRGRELGPRVDMALELAAVGPGMKALELACGHGELLAGAALKGAEVTGVDFSDDCLKHAKQLREALPESARSRLSCVKADVSSLPFSSDSFDRVFLLNTVEHLTNEQIKECLNEVKRVLNPGGVVVIQTLPNRWALSVGYRILRLLKPSLPKEPRTEYDLQVHINEQTIISLAKHLKTSGFNYYSWLENMTVAEAEWIASTDFPDVVRQGAYPLFRRPFFKMMLKLALLTPLRLVATNDIYALAWMKDAPEPRLSLKSKGKVIYDRVLSGMIGWSEEAAICQSDCSSSSK